MQVYMKVIILLAFSSFCMGVAEFIVSGILPALSLHYKVLEAQTGNLATLYALGVVIGAPIISVLISRWTYKIQLAFTLLVFCVANLSIFAFDSFALALIARFISGLMHGLFFVVATLVALKVSPKEKTSTCLSLMVSGLTIALVTGIPLGIFLSESYGLLSPFAFIAAVSALVALIALFIMPKIQGKQGSLKNLLIAFKFPPLIQGFLITAFTCGSMFVIYLYLRVFLEQHGFSSAEIKRVYLYYGIAAILGNLFGGKLTDNKGSYYALLIILCAQILFYTLMSVTHIFSYYVIIANVMAFGFFGFSSISPLKMLCSHLARTFTPKTQNDTIAVNEGAFNVGIALASFIGGLVMHGINVNFNGITAAIFSLSALIILVFYVKRAYFKGVNC